MRRNFPLSSNERDGVSFRTAIRNDRTRRAGMEIIYFRVLLMLATFAKTIRPFVNYSVCRALNYTAAAVNVTQEAFRWQGRTYRSQV